MKILTISTLITLSFTSTMAASTRELTASQKEALVELKKGLHENIMLRARYESPLLRHIDKSFIKNNDRAENLVDHPEAMIKNLEMMEEKKLMEKRLSTVPWSDTYWPLAEGGIGARYNDPEMRFGAWSDYRSYVLSHPADGLIKEKKYELLSPAEKYDFLMGTLENGLTEYSWHEGQVYNDQYHEVESWMGLCHGWSVAAFMLPNPVKTVKVKLNDEESLEFYPSDIKALGTLLWANGQFETRFIGGRCDAKDPSEDRLGRPKDPECLDDNPGTWHMTIVNQIGQFDRAFVMDATYDYQVWNQPVYSYKYDYINLKANKRVHSLREALVSVDEWKKDPRRSVRSPGTKYIVGVSMTVDYVRESLPSFSENQPSLFSTVTYDYDLELDAEKNILGGEWYSRQHPDFLWVADSKAFPRTAGEAQVSVNLNKLSEEVKKAAALNVRHGLPFGPFVAELFKQSAKR